VRVEGIGTDWADISCGFGLSGKPYCYVDKVSLEMKGEDHVLSILQGHHIYGLRITVFIRCRELDRSLAISITYLTYHCLL
jgi:hypothetical protein